jgi:ribulose 1,5-bisphosphate carboxylase large subunit-like protein
MKVLAIQPRLRKRQRIYKGLCKEADMNTTTRKAYAVSIAADPTERLELNTAFLKHLGLWSIEDRRKAGYGKTHEEQKENWPYELMHQRMTRFLCRIYNTQAKGLPVKVRA